MTLLANKQLKEGFAQLYSRYPFEAFITLTYRLTPSQTNMEKHLKKYIQILSGQTGLRLGAIAVIVPEQHRPHLHILVLGANGRGETLCDIPLSIMECLWRYGTAKAEYVYDLDGAANYMAGNHSSTSRLWTYGHRLLCSTKLHTEAA